MPTKTEFDVEFNTYRELSKSFFELFLEISTISDEKFYDDIFKDELGRIDYDKKTYYSLSDKIQNFQNSLFKNAPFIPKTIFSRYENLYKLCNDIFFEFSELYEKYLDRKIKLSERFVDTYVERPKKIEALLFELNDEIRTYLNNLSIIE